MKTRSRATRSLKTPPSPECVRQAERIVDDYRILIERDPPGGFIGTSIEIPTAFGDGATIEECAESTRQALLGAVTAMLDRRELPPRRGRRTAQVNVRLTEDEKLALNETAQRLGLTSISDFIRSVALEKLRR